MENKHINVQAGMGWIGWFFILFWNFGDNKMDLYDAMYSFLTSGVVQ